MAIPYSQIGAFIQESDQYLPVFFMLFLNNVKNNPKGKNPGDMWEITLKHSKEKHFAVFPIELPEKIIQGFCPPDGIVLDTFAGSGTTGIAAMKKNIKSIMIELNPKFCEIMKKRFIDQT
mgnify:CR=1 FL=1